jgi:hypothetical protein
MRRKGVLARFKVPLADLIIWSGWTDEFRAFIRRIRASFAPPPIRPLARRTARFATAEDPATRSATIHAQSAVPSSSIVTYIHRVAAYRNARPANTARADAPGSTKPRHPRSESGTAHPVPVRGLPAPTSTIKNAVSLANERARRLNGTTSRPGAASDPIIKAVQARASTIRARKRSMAPVAAGSIPGMADADSIDYRRPGPLPLNSQDRLGTGPMRPRSYGEAVQRGFGRDSEGVPDGAGPLPQSPPPGQAARGASTVHLDGAALGRWAIQHLERALSKPPSGMTGIDPRFTVPRSRVAPF